MPRVSVLPSAFPSSGEGQASPRRRRSARVLGLTTLASVALHGGFAVVMGVVALNAWVGRREVDVTPPPSAREASRRHLARNDDVAVELVEEAPPVPRAGGTKIARVDGEHAGRGGDATSRESAVNLAPRDEALRLSPDPMTQLDGDQIQRIRVARDRASDLDARETPEPMELTLLVTGKGKRLERRPVAALDPSRGARHAGPEVRAGEAPVPVMTLLLVPSESEDAAYATRALLPSGDPAAGRPGTRAVREAPGTGLSYRRRGSDHRASAQVARARPSVAKGFVATPADKEDARVRDDIDADQEVATIVRSLVHASVAGGAPGDGNGGIGAKGPVGAGGEQGAGSVSMQLGPGDADYFDLGTSDPRLARYFRSLRARIDPLWREAFPKSALLELRQGTVILEFVVAANGAVRVEWPPVRPSGIDEFDKNCAEAVRRAGPFDPIPRDLGRSQLRIRAPFVVRNPIVH